MTRIVVGSTALNYWYAEINRQPADLDIWTNESGGALVDRVEIFWDERLTEWFGDANRVATVDELYTIKCSHSYWELKNGSWWKHMYDLLFLKERGATLLQPLHDILYRIWEEKHGKKVVSLSYGKDDFFQDAVPRIYDHDSIHDSVAFFDEPLYVRTLADGESVKVDSKKMWSLGFDNLVRLFKEEVYATALERLLIPSDYMVSAGRSYLWSLRRTITSLTKGKSAQFIVDNYDMFTRPYEVLGSRDRWLHRHHDKREKLILL